MTCCAVDSAWRRWPHRVHQTLVSGESEVMSDTVPRRRTFSRRGGRFRVSAREIRIERSCKCGQTRTAICSCVAGLVPPPTGVPSPPAAAPPAPPAAAADPPPSAAPAPPTSAAAPPHAEPHHPPSPPRLLNANPTDLYPPTAAPPHPHRPHPTPPRTPSPPHPPDPATGPTSPPDPPSSPA